MLTCKVMRSSVLISAALLVGGVALEILAQTTSFALIANVLAITAMLSSATLMLIALLVGLLPGSLTHLDECQH